MGQRTAALGPRPVSQLLWLSESHILTWLLRGSVRIGVGLTENLTVPTREVVRHKGPGVETTRDPWEPSQGSGSETPHLGYREGTGGRPHSIWGYVDSSV